MDPIMELALLQRRFPDVPVSDYGNLVKDAFCARSFESHTYEGRLFVTEKAVFFVSTYSDAKVYDVHIASGAVESVTAFHRSIIPSLEFTLTTGKEEFTNFHNLSSVVKSLCQLLPGKVKEVKPHGTPIKLNRMTSVPARKPHALSPPPSFVSDPLHMKKTATCPFFIKASFCPRKPFCQFDHGSLLLPSSSNLHPNSLKPTSSSSQEQHIPVNLKPNFHSKASGSLRSPTKRLHVATNSDEEGTSLYNEGMTDSQLERMDFGKILLKKRDEGVVEYVRSQSLPVRELTFEDGSESHSKTKKQNGNGNENVVLDRSRSNSAIDQQEILKTKVESSHSKMFEKSKVSKSKGEEKLTNGERDNDEITGTADLNESAGLVLLSPELEVPKKFDFSGSGESMGKGLPKPATNDEPNDRGQVEGGVFVFTATTTSSSDPSSPDYVKSKKKAVGVSFNLSPQEIVGGGEEISRDEMALLAQQLELGGSDNDSLQGDLDLEYQSRLLASFSKAGERHGPFRGADAESASSSGAGTAKYQSPPRLPRVFPSLQLDKQDQSSKKDSIDTSSSSSASSSSESAGSAVLKPSSVTSPLSGQKRQPCVYFLSGYCRNGPACPDYHGMDPDLEDFEYDDLGLLPIPSKLIVRSANSIGRKDINSGDKIILSPQVLMSCEQQELAYPISFKLEHPSSSEVVYAGVLEFTSPSPEVAFLPQWMMDHLGANEGEEMNFAHVELPKGKFVRLQPVSSAWLGIPYDTRMAMMEFQLRNFQTLTEGTKVTLTYELNRYTLKVLECKPSKGISIVDADLTTDIVEPADFNRYHSIVEGQAVNIGLDEPVTCQLEATYYRHFVLLSMPGQPLPSRLHVEVKSIRGDPDLFLCQSCSAPSQRRYTWCCQDVGDSEIHLSTDDKGFDVNKPLYAGVVSLCEDAEFTITFHRKDTLAAAKARQHSSTSLLSGKTLRDQKPSPTSSPSTSTSVLTTSTPLSNNTPLLEEVLPTATPLPPGHERCSYCGSVMPSLRLIMHQRHCAQSTYKCPLCQTCMPKLAEKKHHFIAHELLVCECGKELTQLALHRHQELDCSKRSVKCQFKWCNLSFPMDQLREHEDLCGRKKMPCPVCHEEVSMLEIEGHLEAFHTVDTSKIDWNKSLSSQVAGAASAASSALNSSLETQNNFSCACGKNFQFQDDLQVHQLTECSFRRVEEDNPLAVADLRPDDVIG